MEGARRLYERLQQARAVVAQYRQWFPQKMLALTAIQSHLKKQGFGDLEPHRLFGKPGYAAFYYQYLEAKAETIYVHGDDLIFMLKDAIVVEVPEPGYATYVFQRPNPVDGFLRSYGQWHRREVLQNRNRIGEQLGFIGRVNHPEDPKDWVEQVETLLRRTSPLGLETVRSQDTGLAGGKTDRRSANSQTSDGRSYLLKSDE